MSPLWQRLELPRPLIDTRAIQSRLSLAGEEVYERLQAEGRWHPEAPRLKLALPTSYLEVIEAAVSYLREDPERRETLLAHYTTWMPAIRVEQLGVKTSPEADFFHTPLVWDALPRLTGGIVRLFDHLEAHGVPAETQLGATDFATYRDATESLAVAFARTCFGGCLPMLYAFPNDLASYLQESRETGFWETFDRRLAAPWVHELSHLGRGREALYPPILDESISGYLGVHVLDSLAYPEEGEDHALMGAPWFAQVGQAFVRVFGWRAVLQAHGGLTSWEETLTPGFANTLQRIGWEQYLRAKGPSFLDGNTTPEIWHKLLYLHAAGCETELLSLDEVTQLSFADVPPGERHPMDKRILRDALRAMCLHVSQRLRSYRVTRRLPGRPIILDLEACRVWRAHGPDDLDPAPPAYLFPPPIASALRRSGSSRLALTLHDYEALDAVVDALWTGLDHRSGSGWEMKAVD